jgi:single-strand DNA-binding protein
MNKKQNKSEDQKTVRAYVNEVRLVGYVGDEPKQYDNHTVISLGTKSSWKPAGSEEWKHHTDWHRVVAWGDLADVLFALTVGDHVQVEGYLRSNLSKRTVMTVDGNQTAVEVKTWEVRARSVCKLQKAKSKEQPEAASSNQNKERK